MNKERAKKILILVFVLAVISIMVFLTRAIPFSPDEYFYSNAAFSVSKALNNVISINSINTEHSALLVLFSGLIVSISKMSSIYFLRLLVVGISLATVYLYLQIFREKFNKSESCWSLLFLLLIPGYFYASSKFILEIPAAFAVALFVLLLMRKSNKLLIGFSLALILFAKEYYFFILVPVAVILSVFDRVYTKEIWWKKILVVIGDIVLLVLPGVLLSLLLVDFNIGPYPRMLENSWKELMQSSFYFFNKYLYFIVEPIAVALKAVNTQVFSLVDYIRGTSRDYGSQIVDLSHTAAKIHKLNIGNNFLSRAIIESPIPVGDSSLDNLNFFQKIWLVYKYNFSDQEFLTVGLGLTILGGICAFGRTIKNITRKYSDYRFDFIMVLLALMFLFFNYQQAVNVHGFRLNVPITFVSVYFSYLGYRAIRDTRRISVRVCFLAIMLALISAYFYNERNFIFGSALSADSIMMTILRLKKYFFVISYLAFVFYLLFNHSIQKKYRELILTIIIIFFFVIKVFPFFLEKKAEMNRTGDDYNLNKSSLVLNTIFSNNNKIVTNVNCYKVYYYASWYMMPNDDISPEFRTFPEKFTSLCYYYDPNSQAMRNNISSDSFYVLSVNDNGTANTNLQIFLDKNKNKTSLVSQEANRNGVILWSIWKYSE